MGLNYEAQEHLAYLSVTNFRQFCLSLLEKKKYSMSVSMVFFLINQLRLLY